MGILDQDRVLYVAREDSPQPIRLISWVGTRLPANATAVGVPAEIVRVGNIKCCPADDLDQQDLPDIVNQRISELEARLSRLEAEKQGEFPPDKKE